MSRWCHVQHYSTRNRQTALGLLDLAQVQQVAAPARRPWLHLAPELLQVDLGDDMTRTLEVGVVGGHRSWSPKLVTCFEVVGLHIFDSWPFHAFPVVQYLWT